MHRKQSSRPKMPTTKARALRAGPEKKKQAAPRRAQQDGPDTGRVPGRLLTPRASVAL